MKRNIFIIFFITFFFNTRNVNAAPSIGNINNANSVAKYEKFEITFDVGNTVAENFQLPYIASPPPGINPSVYSKHKGISVDAIFTNPQGQTFQQPAFIYQNYSPVSSGTGYPIGNKVWKVRFAPNVVGTWSFQLKAQDASGTSNLTSSQTFTVSDSTNKGFIRVSPTDPRYFEFDDGTYFSAVGRHADTTYDQPGSGDAASYAKFGQNGVNLIRDWMSGFYGSAWMHWPMTWGTPQDGGVVYDPNGYLPRTGLEGFKDQNNNNQEYLAMVLAEGNDRVDWYYPCRVEVQSSPHGQEAIQPNKTYKLQITYQIRSSNPVTGPRISGSSNYGLVGKIGGWTNNCQEPNNIQVVTNYANTATTGWTTIQGNWNSGSNTSLPKVHLALENANQGKVWVKDISLREVLPNNAGLGPEVLTETSAEYESYYPERMAHEMDLAINAAKDANIYLKLVVGDKGDMMWWKMQNDGTFVTDGEDDVQDGFYGNLRVLDKKRYLWDAYFRYLTARWGYSTNIHSWEVTNEGYPTLSHYALTDEMGKVVKCRAFGVSISGDLSGNTYSNGKKCTFEHPNRHLVTTSFDHSLYPFWLETQYPNVDYGDVHAYISTGWINKPEHQFDSALLHLDYSESVASQLSGYPTKKPVIRGETGIDYPTNQTEQSGLPSDTNGVWLHNFTWSTLDPGALGELYWWGETINSRPGPDGSTQNGLMEIYKYFNDFVKNIPLNNGKYVDAAATLSNNNLKVVGQKDTLNNRAHLWVRNPNHTWKKVVDNVAETGLAGTLTLSGFTPDTQLSVEWHRFATNGVPNITTSSVTTSGNGNLVLTLPTESQFADVAIKVGNYSTTPSPTPTAPIPGDTNNDGEVDGVDYVVWLTHYNQSATPNNFSVGNFNNDSVVDGLDYVIWLNNYSG